jgi:putative membrane protein
MDAVWLLSGLVLWTPIASPLPELKPASYPVRMVYLFLAGGVMPMFPGGFLTFSGTPLYSLYELAPRVGGFSALGDQQLAGAIMKVGNIPIIWPVIYAMFHHWHTQERRDGERERSSPAAHDSGWVVTPGATTRAGAAVLPAATSNASAAIAPPAAAPGGTAPA